MQGCAWNNFFTREIKYFYVNNIFKIRDCVIALPFYFSIIFLSRSSTPTVFFFFFAIQSIIIQAKESSIILLIYWNHSSWMNRHSQWHTPLLVNLLLNNGPGPPAKSLSLVLTHNNARTSAQPNTIPTITVYRKSIRWRGSLVSKTAFIHFALEMNWKLQCSGGELT